MSNNLEDYIRFNKSLKEFIRALSASYPKVVEYKLLLLTYKTVKTVSKKKPCSIFISLTNENCQEAILAKNEDYFHNNPVECPEMLRGAMAAIKEGWNSMTQENKDVIWQHMQVLVLLSRKCKKIDI